MIPLMNLTRQYESISEELNTTVIDILQSGQYIMGKSVEEFEKMFAEYIGIKYAIGVGNGTDALVIALKAAGVRSGDEVITCAMSFFSTAEAIVTVGAVPIFVDCVHDGFLIDASKIEERITDKTKAIIPIHLYGQCAEMDKILHIAQKYKLQVIEDAAQAAGACYKGKKAGSIGDIGCFSFFPTKNLGCAGDGGIITTDDENLYRQCKAYRAHGSGTDGYYTYCKVNGLAYAEEIDFGENQPKYYNYVVGQNSRLDAIQAAILKVKLPYLEDWNDVRRKIASRYDSEIQNPAVHILGNAPNCIPIYYVYVVSVQRREHFMEYLKEKEITTGIYYPIPLHLQKVFENYNYKRREMPNAEYLADYGVAIPMFAELTEKEIDYIIDVINQYKE